MSPHGALAPWACQDHAGRHIRKAKMDMGMFQKLPDCQVEQGKTVVFSSNQMRDIPMASHIKLAQEFLANVMEACWISQLLLHFLFLLLAVVYCVSRVADCFSFVHDCVWAPNPKQYRQLKSRRVPCRLHYLYCRHLSTDTLIVGHEKESPRKCSDARDPKLHLNLVIGSIRVSFLNGINHGGMCK